MNPARRSRVGFDVEHGCGRTHRMTGWQSATPGLVVFLDGPANAPCGDHEGQEEWNIWQTRGAGVVVGGFGDPESAMRCADQLGRYRNWEAPWTATDPTLREIVEDLDRRGVW